MGVQDAGSLRAALEGAWEASKPDDEESPIVETPQAEENDNAGADDAAPEPVAAEAEAPDKPQVDKATPPRAPDGKFTKAEKQKADKKAEQSREVPTADPKAPAAARPPPATKTPPPTPGASSPTKPPASWRPAEREAFAKAPPEVQAAVVRREREAAMALQEVAPHRQTSETFQKVISPYAGMLAAEGGDPMATTASLWQTWAALRSAPPAAKAQLVANIISTFGVDPGHIAAHLQGQPVQTPQQNLDPAQLAHQVRQQVMGDIQGYQAKQIEAHHAQRLSDFEAANEFADHPGVRAMMARLIDAGLANDFEDAYHDAVKRVPDVAEQLAAREAASQQANAKASTQRARAASSALKSSPAGPTSLAQGKDLRSQLERIYDERAGSRR